MAVTFLPQSNSPLNPVPVSPPELTLVHGGRSSEVLALRSRYLRRRILVGVVALLLVAAFVGLGSLVVRAPVTSSASGEAAAAATGGAALGGSYEVVAGDTLWGIAGSINPHVDRRVVVELLVAANGSESINPGQVLIVPAEISAI